MTMMMTPRLLRSIHAGFVTVAAHDPEPEPALARLHRSAHAVHVHPRPPLSPSASLSLSLLICVSRFCILIALSYSHQHQPPSSPLDGATCATWPPACNSSDNFSLANPLCCTCLRLSCRESLCVCVCLSVLNSHSNWLVHNPEILWIKPAQIHLRIHTHTRTGAHTSAQLNTI